MKFGFFGGCRGCCGLGIWGKCEGAAYRVNDSRTERCVLSPAGRDSTAAQAYAAERHSGAPKERIEQNSVEIYFFRTEMASEMVFS